MAGQTEGGVLSGRIALTMNQNMNQTWKRLERVQIVTITLIACEMGVEGSSVG